MPDNKNLERSRQTNGADWKKNTKTALAVTGKVLYKAFSYILNIFFTFFLVCLVCGIIIGTTFALYIKNYVDTDIDTSMLSTSGTDTTTRIYYMDYEDRENRIGTPVEIENQRIYSSDNSIWVSYSQMPENLINAIVSIEDHRFWDHKGVDWIRTAKAIPNYFFGSDGVFGASTLTQQLIKNLTNEDQVKIQRKVQEIFRALNLEKQMSKPEILEMYLNVVYFGNNCYGVQSASETYFGKDVSELSLVECASLAGIVQNPSKYEPRYHIEENTKRRNDVIFTMLQYGKISESEANQAYDTELNVLAAEDKNTSSTGNNVFSWYTESVFTEVKNDLMEKYGYSNYVASMAIYTGGLQIYTCMDPDVQNVLERVYEENSAETFLATSETLQPESSMVVIDPYTGDVLGLVGARGKKNTNRILNRATGTKRPPGSSIKPLSIYAPAMELGLINYGTVCTDEPIQLDNGDSWPHNLPDVYEGSISLTRAIMTSKNTVAVRILQQLTPQTSYDFLTQKLHFTSLVESVATEDGRVVTDIDLSPLALGQFSYGITVKEITAGYTIFPNMGVYSKPRLYLSVTDSNGNNVLTSDSEQEIVISEQTASVMTKLLMSVTEYHGGGTANNMSLAQVMDAAGKTGTSTADFDRWFIGFTPYYLAGVWVGYDNNIALSSFASNPASNIWNVVMTELHRKYIDAAAAGTLELEKFSMSPGVQEFTCCRDTGLLANEYCPETVVSYFTVGNDPDYCKLHDEKFAETAESETSED